MNALLPQLALGVFRLEFHAVGAVRFPEFAGSAWRGAFGHALKRIVCVTRERDCRQCMLYRTCAYPYVFQTPPPEGTVMMRRYESVPHPFVLRPVERLGENDRVSLALTIFGDAIRHLPMVIYALKEAAGAERGIAGNRLELRRVLQEESPGSDAWIEIFREGGAIAPLPAVAPMLPPVPNRLEVRVHTPLRLKRSGLHVCPEAFGFSDLFGNILRRVSMLTYFHGGTRLDAPFRELMDRSRSVTSESALRWKDWVRYSARQKTQMRLGGLVGVVRVSHQDLAPFWPFLWIGQWTHAGAGTTMGLGHYTLASLPEGELALERSMLPAVNIPA